MLSVILKVFKDDNKDTRTTSIFFVDFFIVHFENIEHNTQCINPLLADVYEQVWFK